MHSVFWTLAKSQRAGFGGARSGITPPWTKAEAEDDSTAAERTDVAGHAYNAFIQESTLDEIAFAGGADPLELRRELMSPYPAATRLIDAIEVASSWKEPLRSGSARGFAFLHSAGTWIAAVVEVAQADGGVRIGKVVCTADPGFVRDERSYCADLAAAIRSSLAASVGPETSLAGHEPEIVVELLRGSAHAGRLGKPVVPPVNAALANAVFALTGRRVRSMPVGDEIPFV